MNYRPFNSYDTVNGTDHHLTSSNQTEHIITRGSENAESPSVKTGSTELPSPYMANEKGFFQRDVIISSLSHTRNPIAMRITFSGLNCQSCITDPLHCFWSQYRFPLFLTRRRTRRLSYKIEYRGADKSLTRPGRKQATVTEDFVFHIFYL